MPLSARRSVASVKVWLGQSGPATPNYDTIVRKMNLQANKIGGFLNITAENESFKRFTQPIDANRAEYQINQPDWGSPFLVETWDQGTDPLFVPQEVTIAPIQNRDRYRVSQWDSPASGLIAPSDIVVSFFTLDRQATMSIQPVFTQAMFLRIYYETESFILAFDDNALPIRDQFNDLLVIKTALACLPDTGHDDATYSRIEKSLLREAAELTELFEHQRFQMNAEDNSRSAFGWEREDGGFW